MRFIDFNIKLVALFLLLAQVAWADWVGPYQVGSVSSTVFGEGISVTIDGEASISGCPGRIINEMIWSAPGTDEEKDKVAGDMLISALMSAQAQGVDVSFDVVDPCSEGGVEFTRARLSY